MERALCETVRAAWAERDALREALAVFAKASYFAGAIGSLRPFVSGGLGGGQELGEQQQRACRERKRRNRRISASHRRTRFHRYSLCVIYRLTRSRAPQQTLVAQTDCGAASAPGNQLPRGTRRLRQTVHAPTHQSFRFLAIRFDEPGRGTQSQTQRFTARVQKRTAAVGVRPADQCRVKVLFNPAR
jgi:hypothetical protein